MASVLVTGGAGYVGSVCSARLLEQGHRVTVVDDLTTGHAEAIPAGAAFHRTDVGNRITLAAILQSGRFDVVFHFAAKALIPESVTNPGPFFDVNVASGIAMLEILREAGIRKAIFSSSAAVYGTPETIPIFENHCTRPMNAYGQTKLMFERILDWYARAYGWSAIAFRYFNAAGAVGRFGENHQPETHIIPRLLDVAFGESSHFQVYGDDYPTPDGTCLRDYVHVSDIAEAHMLALEHLDGPGMQIFNLGTGTPRSVKEVYQTVERLSGRKLPIQMAPRRPGDPAVLCASPERVARGLGWAPRHLDLFEIIESAWAWKESRVMRPRERTRIETNRPIGQKISSSTP